MARPAAARAAVALVAILWMSSAGLAAAHAAACTIEPVRPETGERRERFISWLRIYSKQKGSPPWDPEKFGLYRVYVADIDNDGVEEYVLTDEDVPDTNDHTLVHNIVLSVFRPAAPGWIEIETPFDPATGPFTEPVSGRPSPLLVRCCGKTYVNTEGGTDDHSFRDTLIWRGKDLRSVCDATWLAEQRRLFQTIFDHQLYDEAHDFLAGVSRSCAKTGDARSWLWMQSDLALTAYRLGRMNTCLEHVAAARRSQRFARAGDAVRGALAATASLCSAARSRPATSYDFSWLRELERPGYDQDPRDPRFGELLVAVAPDAKLGEDGEALGDRLKRAVWDPASRWIDDRYVILSGCEPHECWNSGGIWIDLATRRSIVWLENASGPGEGALLASRSIDAAHVPREFWEHGPFAPFEHGNMVKYFGPDGKWRKVVVQ